MNIRRFSDVMWTKTSLTTAFGEYASLRNVTFEKVESETVNGEEASQYRIKHGISEETLFLVTVAEAEREDLKAFVNAIVKAKLQHG